MDLKNQLHFWRLRILRLLWAWYKDKGTTGTLAWAVCLHMWPEGQQDYVTQVQALPWSRKELFSRMLPPAFFQGYSGGAGPQIGELEWKGWRRGHRSEEKNPWRMVLSYTAYHWFKPEPVPKQELHICIKSTEVMLDTKPLSFNQGIYYNFSNLQTEGIRPAMNQKSSPQNLKLEAGLNLHEALREIMSNSASPTMGSCKGRCISQSGCPFQAQKLASGCNLVSLH